MDMHTGKKKITALGLVLLLAIPLLFSVIIIVKQKVLQINSRLSFGTEKLETISVSKKNINWVKKGKEILINKMLFDVKSYKAEGENILLTGYYDHKEVKLVNHLNKIFQQKKDSNSPINQIAVKFLFFPIFNNHTEIICQMTWHVISDSHYSFADMLPSAPGLPITQPPQL